MSKKQLGLLAGALTALVLMGAGCNSSNPNNMDDQGNGDQKNVTADQDQSNYPTKDNEEKNENNKTDETSNTDLTAPTTTTVTTATVKNDNVKEFTITAKNWDWSPNTITVKKGDKVRLKITSTDVTHSFMMKDYNLNVMLEPGQTQTVEFVADKAGTFSFRCGVPCGEGHRTMTGTLIVQ